MAESQSRRRRRSKDFPPSFRLICSKDYGLYLEIIELLKLGEDVRTQLQHHISEQEKISRQMQEYEKKMKTGQKVALITCSAGAVLTLLSIPLTGGASLAALGIGAASMSGAFASVGVDEYQIKEFKKAVQKWEDEKAKIEHKLEPLKKQLSKVEKICKTLREEEKDFDERLNLFKLERQIKHGQTLLYPPLCLSDVDKIITMFETALKQLHHKYTDVL